ncbi:MAG TPA: molybdopterin cofactor-binding domain-containing protein [Bryobacteraceae bacterium]|nr:molybdopterin cofactor-binding domain-containing protein [Bryobacteraceae bacterium]
MPEIPGFETERYELHEGPGYRFATDRRDFFKLVGGGLIVLLALRTEAGAQESGGARRGGQSMPQDIGAWLHISESGAITVYTGKVEMGQNIRTSLTQAVAEELRTQPSQIQLVMGDTMLTPFDFGTVGSMTTPIMAPQLRKVAATAREMLLDLAARQWKTDRGALVIANGAVKNPASGDSLSFGQLTRGQKLARTITPDARVTPATEWKIAGHDMKKVNARSIVTGQEKFTSDMKLPGMMYGRVVRPAAFKATLASADLNGAKAMPGVIAVRDGEFVGVACDHSSKLDPAAAAIRTEWKTTPQTNSRELFAYLKSRPAAMRTVEGDVTHEATYNVAYIAHTPLEPRAAVAQWDGDRLTVWTGTQRPFGVRSELAQAFGIPEDHVRVMVPATGSGYGGKHTGECATEAARLAKAAGKPVKLQWTREEEFTWAYFRPAGVIDVKSGARRDGTITGWEFHNYNSGNAAIRSPYNIPNQVAEFHPVDSPLRQGSYRGLAASANHFARESHMDELAHAIGMEPAAFRMKNATDQRLRAVIEAATEKFRWGRAKNRAGQGFGMMAGFDKGGYVSACVEITVVNDRVRVDRIVQAFECGAVVNPDQLRNQIAGGTMMGIGGALFEAMEFENGRILNPRLSKYRVPRFSDMPEIEVVLVDRKDLPSAGAGETPIVAVAPSVANAIFDATGKRIRSMPLKLS